MDDCADVGCNSRGVVEEPDAEKGCRGDKFLVVPGADYAGQTEQDRAKCGGVGPRKHVATPRQTDKSGGHGCDKES